MERRALRQAVFGGYEKESVLDLIEDILQKSRLESKQLQSQLKAQTLLIESLKEENRRLHEMLAYYQEQEDSFEQRVDQTVKMLVGAQRMKAQQLDELERKKEQVLTRTQADTQDRAQAMLLRQQEELQSMLESFAGFIENSAQSYTDTCEDVADAIARCQEENKIANGES